VNDKEELAKDGEEDRGLNTISMTRKNKEEEIKKRFQ